VGRGSNIGIVNTRTWGSLLYICK